MDIARELDLVQLLQKKSYFLFGPRGTGKSWLIRKQKRPDWLMVDLLHSDELLELSARPSVLREKVVAAKAKLVVIDEIQRVPLLLNEVHSLIEEQNARFLLTGSSARRLKKEHANLLGGRAWEARLFPLIARELGQTFELEKALRYGTLPAVYTSEDPHEELRAYVSVYLKEEIQQEGWVRNLPPFSRFLTAAAATSGELLNYASIGSDSQVPATTVREYYQILDDTLIGGLLDPWTRSKKRKAIMTGKFYFFDTGILHQLMGIKGAALERNSPTFGKAFEHWMIMELRAWLSYTRRDEALTFWRTDTRHEVDVLIGDHTAIELKASKKVSMRDARGLLALREENQFRNYIVVSTDPSVRQEDQILFLPWQEFLHRLWAHAWGT